MTGENYLTQYADQLTEVVFDFYTNKDNEMALHSLLLGKGNYLLETFPNAGHNYYEVLNAIYRYSKQHTKIKIANIMEDAFVLCALHIVSLDDFSMLMNYIFTHLKNEKIGKAPFKINFLPVLKAINHRIFACEKLINDIRFMESVKKTETYLQRYYGLSILINL